MIPSYLAPYMTEDRHDLIFGIYGVFCAWKEKRWEKVTG